MRSHFVLVHCFILQSRYQNTVYDLILCYNMLHCIKLHSMLLLDMIHLHIHIHVTHYMLHVIYSSALNIFILYNSLSALFSPKNMYNSLFLLYILHNLYHILYLDCSLCMTFLCYEILVRIHVIPNRV